VAAVAEQRDRDEQPVTSQGFGSLYYTDCLPGQGLRGGAGFQFQAVSAGVDHDTMALVQRSTLYEAPVSWMREHRPVEEYPPSLTHVFDGRYVTARGVYLGAEANGVREGNQFTHAVATEDAEAYGMVRPAQLWEAPWWSERPAAGTECAPVDADPETGPWGIEAVREWVLGQPNGEEWLTAVFSSVDRVHDDDRRRVVFVSTDPAPVLCWLAAATLLLPQARAVRVSFRVFATNPQYSDHDVLALHPDWAGQFAHARGTAEFVVFNVDTGAYSPVPPTDAATEWVPRFLRDDPFDVIDAIEMAHQFARSGTTVPAHEARASTADLVASKVVLFNETATDPEESALLSRWLATRTSPPADEVALPLVHAVLAGPRDVAVLRELDATVHRHRRTAPTVAAVRRALLGAEVEALAAGAAPESEPGPLRPVSWSDGDSAEVTAFVEQAADAIEPTRFMPLLRTAKRFGVTPRDHLFRNGIHRFVQWWADHSTEKVDLAGLPCRAAVLDQLRDELAHRMASGAEKETAAIVHRDFWQLFKDRIDDPSAPLDRTVAAAAMAHGDMQARAKLLTHVVTRIGYLRLGNGVDVAWAALFAHVPPTIGELAWLLRHAPAGAVSPVAADKAYDVVDKETQTRITTEALDVLDRLAARGATPPRGRLADLTVQYSALTRWLANAPTVKHLPNSPAMADIRKVPATVLKVRAGDVLDVLLTGTTLDNAGVVVDNGGDDLRALLGSRLPEIWGDPDANSGRRNTAVALGYLTASAPDCADLTYGPLIASLRRWAADNESRHDEVGKLLHAVDPEYAKNWKAALTTGLLAPKKVSTPRSSSKDDRDKPEKGKKEKKSVWRITNLRGKD
jgi:hypothetical protein